MAKTILSVWFGVSPLLCAFFVIGTAVNTLTFMCVPIRAQENAKRNALTSASCLMATCMLNIVLRSLNPGDEPVPAVPPKFLLFAGIGMLTIALLCGIGLLARHLIKIKAEVKRLQSLKNDGRILLLTADTYKSLNLADPDTYPFATEAGEDLFKCLEEELHIAFLPKERRVMEKHIEKKRKLQCKIERLQAAQEQQLLALKERQEKEERKRQQVLQERKETMQRAQEMLKTISEDRKRVEAQNAAIVKQQKELVTSMVEADQRQRPQGA